MRRLENLIPMLTFKLVSLLACTVMLMPFPAQAGDPLSQPSDVDIHVAYCLGVEEVSFNNERALAASTNPLIRDYRTRMAGATQSRLDRLNDYLDLRLPLVREDDMDVASKRGFLEATQGLAIMKRSACSIKCRPLRASPHNFPIDPNVATKQSCQASCDSNLPKIWTCQDLSWLG